MSRLVAALRTSAGAVTVALLVAWIWRVFLILGYPGNYAFDGLQRWAGRDYVLVQDWLPAAQAVVRICAALDLSLAGARGAMAMVGAASVAVCVAIAGRLGGPAAAWACVPFAIFGPHVTWTIVPYQEGVFLLLVMGAVLLGLYDRWLLADILMGASGLVRYEGWPFVLVWLVWRRDPRALLALWGASLWLVGKFGLGWEGHHPSPVDIRDWEGMFERFDLGAFFRNTGYNLERLWDSGAWVYILGCVGGAGLVRNRASGLIWIWLAIQVAITFAWMIALERSMSRMLVVPITLLAPLGAVGLAHLWRVASHRTVPSGSEPPASKGQKAVEWVAGRVGVAGAIFVLALLLAMQGFDGWWRVQREADGTHWERSAVTLMRRCPECVWWIEPRADFGPRGRHNGCEVIQGLSSFRVGKEFYCAPWLSEAEAAAIQPRLTSRMVWSEKKDAYTLWRTWDPLLVDEPDEPATGAAPKPVDLGEEAGP